MTTVCEWLIEPSTRKNVVEFIRYENDEGDHIVHATYYRWGQAIVTSHTKPDYKYDENGNKFISGDNNLVDCYASEIVEFSATIDEESKQKLIDFVDEYGINELEDEMGWSLIESEIRIYGPLQINKL
jgi:hypothetical protein